jgi:hypothetical protein
LLVFHLLFNDCFFRSLIALGVGKLVHNMDVVAFLKTILLKLDESGSQCEQSVISPHADVFSGEVFCSSLTYDDISWNDIMATKLFHSEVLRLRVATILGAATSLLRSKANLCKGERWYMRMTAIMRIQFLQLVKTVDPKLLEACIQFENR